MLPQEYFYTAQPNEVQVDYDTFIDFIHNYPRNLTKGVCGISDPPTVSYNDFELANRWPYSIIAHTWVYKDDPNDYWYEAPENRKYYIVENYEELFNSKTGNKA